MKGLNSSETESDLHSYEATKLFQRNPEKCDFSTGS